MANDDDKPVDLQAVVAKRKSWLFECQLRRLNLDSFRNVCMDVTDPIQDLISEPLLMMGHPAGQIGLRPQVGTLKSLGPVYLDSQEPVWTCDEHSRRDAFAGGLIGKMCNWLDFHEPYRLQAALAKLKEKFEKSRFSSLLDVDLEVERYARKNMADDAGNMGQALSRAFIATAKPWLIPELYQPKHADSQPAVQWLENLEQFLLDYEGELQIAVGGIAGMRLPFNPSDTQAYRTWLRLLLGACTTRNVGDSVKASFLEEKVDPCDDNKLKYRYEVKIRTTGFPLGNAVDFPHSFKVGYWTRIVRSPLGEVIVHKPNSDMGLCMLMRLIYLFGDLPAALGAGQDLPWRKRTTPSPDLDEFFNLRAGEPGVKEDPAVLQRLRSAQARLRVILEECAANPRSGSLFFSPIVQEVLRQGIRTYKFWLDEELRAQGNDRLNRARIEGGVLKEDDKDAEMEFWSENHYIMFASSEYLAGQLWEADQFQPGPQFLGEDKKLGILSGRERKERGRARVLKWLNNRLMFGWTEFNSSGYYREHLWAILNLADFALDKEVRDKATLAIDLLLFDVVRYTHRGSSGAAGGRCQFKSKSSGWDNALSDVIEILLGTRGIFVDGDSHIGLSLASSNYKTPDVLLEIGTLPPNEPWVDRSRVSITFEEAPKYDITYSMESDAIKSLHDGYASRRDRYYPFLAEVNREISRTHRDYTSIQDDAVFWWGTSAFFNKQIVRRTLDCVKKYGLGACPAFKDLETMIKTIMPILETVKSSFLGGLFGGVGGTIAGKLLHSPALGPLGVVAGTTIGFVTELDESAIEDGADDLSLFLEGSTRTRANILTYRNSGAMLSSMQNFRAGQLNFQSNVNHATLTGALSVFTSSGFEGLDISDFYAAIGGIYAGAVVGQAGVGAAVVVGVNEGIIDGMNPFNPSNGDEDGPGWWTGYWALPRVVQHRSAAILMYDFYSAQEFLAETGSHVWFPKVGFANFDEVRSSAYDDDNFFLADIDNIGPKGFWLFGKVAHEVPGVPVADRPEGYIGVFSNQGPEWLSLENDEEIYERRMDEASEDAIEKLRDEVEDILDELDDDDNVGYVNRQVIEIVVTRTVRSHYRQGIERTEWIDSSKRDLTEQDIPLLQKRRCKIDKLVEKYVDLWNAERVWKKPLPQDYFADRDRYVNGKNIWIVQVGSKDEFGSYETFKDRLSSAKVTIDDNGDMECTYHMPLPGGGSDAVSMKYEDGGEFRVNDQPFEIDLYPRFENPFLRSGRAEWGQRQYVIEYRGKQLLHDLSDFSNPKRSESVESKPGDASIVKAFVIFLRTSDEKLEEFTNGTAAIRIGCDTAAEEQVIAAGPVGEDTMHDAEWIFCDRELTVSPDLTLTLKHHAFGEGDDDTEWKVGFTLKALMGDYTLKDCTASFPSVSFEEDRQMAGPLPFSILLSQWHDWTPVPDSRPMRSCFLADRARWDAVYYSYVDLFGLDADSRLWHRRVNACFTGTPEWQTLPSDSGTPKFDGPFSICAISVFPGALICLVAYEGNLFVTWREGETWTKWITLDPWRYALDILGIPDTSQPPIPLAAAARGPLFAGPSASASYALEVFFLGVDGDLYGHYEWQPWVPGPWQRIKVRDFAMREGSDAQLVADRMFVLSTDGTLWSSSRVAGKYTSSWEVLSPPWLALSRFAVFTEPGSCHVIATADGSIWATMINSSQAPEWIPLGKPGGSTVPPEMRVAGAIPYTGHLDIFAIASDGIVYTRGWNAGKGWDDWHRPMAGEQGFTAASGSSPAVAHRVNRQIEVFIQTQDSRLLRTWWS